MPPRETNSSTIRVKEYNPDGSAQSKPICPEEWGKHETRIRALHRAGTKRADALEQLRADCGCAQNCLFNPSPSQYSAQLKVWGLRTYKIKATVPTHSEFMGSNNMPQMHTETTPRTPPRQIYSGGDQGSQSRSSVNIQSSVSNPSFDSYCPTPESVERDGVGNYAKQVEIEASRTDSHQFHETPPLYREQDDDMHVGRSLPPSRDAKPPQHVQKVYPFFTASETVESAVRRVVQALSEVLADPELEEFFDNLTDMELDELLINHIKVKDACEDALMKHTGKLWRVGEDFGPRPTRLVQIRDALEDRARRVYCSTPQAASIESDTSAMALASSNLDQTPATHYGDSTETAASVQIYDEDTEMQQDLRVSEASHDVYDLKSSTKISGDEVSSCLACVDIPNVDYEVSVIASRLWSELNSRQDRAKALDEMGVLACCSFAAQSYTDAFDLYFIIWTESEYATLDDKLARALACARSSATASQDACVEAILHHLLSVYARQRSSSGNPTTFLAELMLHSFLGDLYARLKKEASAEIHMIKATLHLGEDRLHSLEQRFCYRQVVAALESQIARRQKIVSQAIGYTASTLSVDQAAKGLETDIQDVALLNNLLGWCAEIISDNSRGMDAFSSVLPKQPIEQRGFICRTLFCYFIEKWLDERQRSSKATNAVARSPLLRLEIKFSLPETLSAIAMLIVHDCPDLSRPHSPSGRQPYSWILSSTLLKNIKQLVKLKTSQRSFLEIYQSLMAASGEVRRQPLSRKSHTMLAQFMMNIAPTSLVNRHLPSRGIGPHNRLVPSPDIFRELEIRPASWSNRLYSPHSSFSSGLNSIRAAATKSMLNSVLSIANRSSGVSGTTMSTSSYRSSWSFGAVTGLRRAPSMLSDTEMLLDTEADSTLGEPQDEEMGGI